MTGPSPGTDRTEIREIEEPRPGPGEVTIDVAYAGINFIDVMARRGDAAYASAWPYAPGLEVSGAVITNDAATTPRPPACLASACGSAITTEAAFQPGSYSHMQLFPHAAGACRGLGPNARWR